MKAKARWPERLRYWFDNTMSRGTPALVAWLGLASLVLVATVGGLARLLTPTDTHDDIRRVLWMSLLRTLDPGTMGGDDGSPFFLALMLGATIGGIFIVSALVGVLAAGLDAKLAELRKGRSRLVEYGHTVVLGWSDQVYTVVSELVAASDGQRTCIAILADQDKVAMEEAIRSRVKTTRRVRVICRRGNPADPIDVALVRPDLASTIIVLTPVEIDADIRVIKSLLALRNQAWPHEHPPIVTAVSHSHNLPAAILAAGPSATVVDAKDIIARLVVQSRRQPGLSAVWTELLSFADDEICMVRMPPLAGHTYGDCQLAFDTCAVFGLRYSDGRVDLNPSPDTRVGASDLLILVAKSKSSIRLADRPPPTIPSAISQTPPHHIEPDRTLVLGWNAYGPTIMALLERYLPSGSTVTVACHRPEPEIRASLDRLTDLAVTVTTCDTLDRPSLEALNPSQYQHVVVLADDSTDPADADSRTLITLLHLRDMKKRDSAGYAIVSELNDDANRRLAQVTKTDDFVIGKKLITLYLAQLSQNPHLSKVFAELFDARGSDIYLRPASEYLVPGVAATFATVVEAARRRHETAIGYRIAANGFDAPSFGVVVNPTKAKPLTLHADDCVIVLALV